jgi:hypothetical protein
MSSPALSRGLRKGIRTIVQVAAGGALTALVTAVAGGLAPTTQAIVMGAWIAFVAFSQNWAEGAGKINVLLPTPAIVTEAPAAVAATAGAVVEMTLEETGEIVGEVIDVVDETLGNGDHE